VFFFLSFFLSWDIFLSCSLSWVSEPKKDGNKEKRPKKERKKEKYFPQLLVRDSIKKVRDVQMIALPFGIWVIGVAPRRVRKINQTIEVRTSKMRVLTFSLSG